jgi:hypothetical protein
MLLTLKGWAVQCGLLLIGLVNALDQDTLLGFMIATLTPNFDCDTSLATITRAKAPVAVLSVGEKN